MTICGYSLKPPSQLTVASFTFLQMIGENTDYYIKLIQTLTEFCRASNLLREDFYFKAAVPRILYVPLFINPPSLVSSQLACSLSVLLRIAD